MFETTLPTVAELEAELIEHEAEISRHRAAQLTLLRQIEAAQAPLAAGCRNLTEWAASRLDVAPETARALTSAMRKVGRWAGPMYWLESGEYTLDRAVASADLLATCADFDDLPGPFALDIEGMRRLASHNRRVTAEAERDTFGDRYLTLQPTLDNSRWKLWGELPGYEGAIVDQALLNRATTFPALPDGSRPTRSQQAADALTAMAQDELDGGSATGTPSAPLATIFVDASLAAPSNGEAGATVAAGPQVGPDTLDRIRCEGTIEVTVVEEGRPIWAGPAAHSIPPKLRRFVLWRDGGCSADGCQSRYRLQPHHIAHKAAGGSDDPDNLVALCWFHHHVVIHGYGYRIDPDSPRKRIRFLGPDVGRDPPDGERPLSIEARHSRPRSRPFVTA